ncbi:MAG: transcriptional regulator [Candidatus Thermoplasmatota archaeon]|nr:transcriptional regulator [Candidatus Thermoplasmatota archaeon]
MITITVGSLEEQIIKLLRKTYPITIIDIAQKLRVPKREIEWVLHKFQMKGIVKLEPLPNITYVKLMRNDFHFVGSKYQRKTIKHTSDDEKEKTSDYEGIMYS